MVGQVLEFVEEPQTNGKTISWCQVRVAPEASARRRRAVRGIVCGAHNFAVGDKVVVTLPGAVLPGPFPIAARKTYGHVSDGMIASVARARPRRRARRHPAPRRRSGSTPRSARTRSPCSASTTPPSRSTSPPTAATRCRSAASRASTRTPPARRSATRPLGRCRACRSPTAFPVTIDDEAPIRGRVGASRVRHARRCAASTRPGPTPRVDGRAAEARRHPLDLARRRHHQLRDARTRPADPRLRPRQAAPAASPCAAPTAGGEPRPPSTARVARCTPRTCSSPTTPARSASPASWAARPPRSAPTTTDVLIEAANFDPISIARTARRHKLPSEASRRFERGVDPAGRRPRGRPRRAAARRTRRRHGRRARLATTTRAPRRRRSALADGYVAVHRRRRVHRRRGARRARPRSAPRSSGTRGGLLVTPPTWRPDLRDKADLAEEVARIVGYDRIPSVLPGRAARPRTDPRAATASRRVATHWPPAA